MTAGQQTEAQRNAELARPTASIRDTGLLRDELLDWLTAQLPATAAPQIDSVTLPAANGMSSETILVDATWAEDGERRQHPLVARVAPGETTMPVFPSYDMHTQFEVVRSVAAHSAVPVPATYWSEQDPGPLGAPFFVMQRIDGQVPPDVMPYNFGSWVSEATAAERERLQQSTVATLAQLHAIPDPATNFAFLGSPGRTGGEALRAHIAGQRAYYEWVSADGPRSPLLERCLAELEANCPVDDSPPVSCWGDSRIGNIIYRDFEPVAVLDWEMAAFGTPEMDLGWMIFLHRFFEDLAKVAGLAGLPDFLRRDAVADSYRELTGRTPVDLDFYTLYAAVRHAIVMFRVQSRAIHFGQAQAPDNPDDMILHRPTLEAMLAGTYWDGVA